MPPPLIPEKAGDWLYIQSQYELAEKSVPQIAKETGVPVQRIFATATRNGWQRAQNSEIVAQQRAELRLARESQDLAALQQAQELAVEVNTRMQAQMLATHRQDIGIARNLTMRLFGELDAMMTNQDLLKDLGDEMRCEDKGGRDKKNDTYNYVIGFEGRVDALKKLSEASKNFILLERQAMGVGDQLALPGAGPAAPTPTENAMDAILKKFDVVLTSKDSKPLPPADVIENGVS